MQGDSQQHYMHAEEAEHVGVHEDERNLYSALPLFVPCGWDCIQRNPFDESSVYIDGGRVV